MCDLTHFSVITITAIVIPPANQENALTNHPAVLEAAVVAQEDDEGLIKPKAYIVLNKKDSDMALLSNELKAHVKQTLAPYKYPRWIEFTDELPKTATGKIQKLRLREQYRDYKLSTA